MGVAENIENAKAGVFDKNKNKEVNDKLDSVLEEFIDKIDEEKKEVIEGLESDLKKAIKELKNKEKKEMVDHPAHYNAGKIEVIDFVEDQNLGFHEGNIVKYICRHPHKNGLEDIKKAKWYIDRLISKKEKELIGSKD